MIDQLVKGLVKGAVGRSGQCQAVNMVGVCLWENGTRPSNTKQGEAVKHWAI